MFRKDVTPMDYKEIAANVKADSFQTATLSRQVRDLALKTISDSLRAHKDEIFLANEKDLKQAEADNLPGPIKSRLKFDEHKLVIIKPWNIFNRH